MMIKLGSCTLDVDTERTRAFYARADIPTASKQCSCPNCQNFDQAILRAPAAVLALLRSLGIDPQKPAEVYNVLGDDIEEAGTVWYNGWYHICGSIADGSDNVQVIDETHHHIAFLWENSLSPDPAYPFRLLPVSECVMLHKEFPAPTVQLEIDAHLPYIIK